jgi:hypothetical protein
MTIDAGELKDKIMDTNAVIKSTAGSAVENLGTGIAKAGKVGIDAFAGMTGAMGLFGIESEGAMQAMLKLQQLAAMSEALTSLGALGDTVTEVKAAFIAAATKLGIFTTAKEVDVAVTETQIVATNAATVSTNFLGKAMKALPIVAIIAGIAAIAYAIYNYVSASADAEKATKARVEAEKKANEEAKATRDFIAQESSEFVGLVYQLKATNKGSEERSRLIKQINSQYGTTLKNISDETAFQAALNLAVKDYIKYQRQKYQLTQNKKKIEDILKQEEIYTNKLIAAQLALNQAKFQGGQGGGGYQDVKKLQDAAQADIKRYSGTLKMLDNQLMDLGYSNVKLAQETEDKYIPSTQGAAAATNNLNNETKDLVSTNEDLKKSLDDLITAEFERTHTAEQNLLKEKELKDLELKRLFDVSTDKLNRDKQLKDALLLNEADYQAKLKLITEQKDVTQAETDVLDLQLKIKKAKGLELIAFQVMLKEAQLKVLNEQEEVELLNLGKNEVEKDKVRADYRLKRANLEEEFKDKSIKTETDITDETKASLEKRLKTQEEFIKMTTDFFIKNSEKKIAQMDKEIAKAESQYTLLQTLAANGNINAQESLAEQQRIINDANARKDKEMKRQQRIKLAESVYSTYNSKVAGGSEHPLMDTIKDTMLLQQFIASLPTFFDGTENTGKNGNGIDGKGGFHAVLHPNERVIPKSLNEQIGGLSNEALAKMASEYQNGKIIRSNSQVGSAFDTAILVNELKTLNETIKAKPETNINIGEITQSVMEIVKSTKQGNTTTYNRYKVRR